MITKNEYKSLDQAYEHFNKTLFKKSLPNVLITFQRKANSKGYFAPDRFTGRQDESTTHELALNPDVFGSRSDMEILSTLVHEMVHVWQQTHGRAPRRAYHDRQWANKMEEVGLMPSATGEPGGNKVGQHMTHYIIEGGPFETSCKKLLASDWKLNWNSSWVMPSKAVPVKSKVKFTCPSCECNAWGKPTLNLVCGDCDESMISEDA